MKQSLRRLTAAHPHLWYQLYWVVYLVWFFTLDNVIKSGTLIHCALDDRIPFCEWFVVFYCSWFALLVFVTLKLWLNDTAAYDRLCLMMFSGMQNEWAGAQAFSSFDTYLAPFVKADNLSYYEVKKAIESFIYGVNTPSRWGTQAPFSNITLDWTVPADLAEQQAIVGGKQMDFKYKDCKAEMDMSGRRVGGYFCRLPASPYSSAISSISHKAPLGRVLTATQLRAGLEVK